MSRSITLNETLTDYVRRANPAESPALVRCREETASRTDANMQISPEQGAFMKMMVRMLNARTCVEVGVFTGYSALATAEALKERHGTKARLYALDVSPEYVGMAERYWKEGGVADIIQPIIGPASQSLIDLINDGASETIDLMFVDADKPGYDAYFTAAMTLLRPGGVILFDNVLWDGQVADLNDQEDNTRALRAIAERVHADARFDHAFTTIGDGLLMAMKR